jgi:DNA primase
MFLNEFVRRASNVIFEYDEPIQYLNGRGIVEDDIRTYSLGYVRHATVKKEDSEDYRELSEGTYNFRLLQKKILFPLRNILGAVNGICTRDIVQKRYNQFFLSEARNIGAFFGLYEALPHINKTKRVFVHEGAINSISFAKVFPNAISSLTSFLNEAQYETLTMICDKIVLVYDDDLAGHTGEYKMKKYYGDKYIETVFIGEDDSNSYLNMLGLEKFKEYIRYKIPKYLQG